MESGCRYTNIGGKSLSITPHPYKSSILHFPENLPKIDNSIKQTCTWGVWFDDNSNIYIFCEKKQCIKMYPKANHGEKSLLLKNAHTNGIFAHYGDEKVTFRVPGIISSEKSLQKTLFPCDRYIFSFLQNDQLDPYVAYRSSKSSYVFQAILSRTTDEQTREISIVLTTLERNDPISDLHTLYYTQEFSSDEKKMGESKKLIGDCKAMWKVCNVIYVYTQVSLFSLSYTKSGQTIIPNLRRLITFTEHNLPTIHAPLYHKHMSENMFKFVYMSSKKTIYSIQCTKPQDSTLKIDVLATTQFPPHATFLCMPTFFNVTNALNFRVLRNPWDPTCSSIIQIGINEHSIRRICLDNRITHKNLHLWSENQRKILLAFLLVLKVRNRKKTLPFIPVEIITHIFGFLCVPKQPIEL